MGTGLVVGVVAGLGFGVALGMLLERRESRSGMSRVLDLVGGAVERVAAGVAFPTARTELVQVPDERQEAFRDEGQDGSSGVPSWLRDEEPAPWQ